MTGPLSNDLRERVVAAVLSGESCRSAAARFGVAVSSAVKWTQRYRSSGSVAPDKVGGHRKRVLEPHRNFIVGQINLGSHKSAAIRQMIRTAGARLWFLPPYSPDLNPIGQAFAKIRHWMRIARKRTIEDTWRHIGHLVSTIRPTECANCITNAGYASVKA